jgi:hypothetical protein
LERCGPSAALLKNEASKMNFIYDWTNREWVQAHGKILEKNSLFTFWLCKVVLNKKEIAIPAIEYFNGTVYIPFDLHRYYPWEICYRNYHNLAPNGDMQWVEMATGKPALMVNGLPL